MAKALKANRPRCASPVKGVYHSAIGLCVIMWKVLRTVCFIWWQMVADINDIIMLLSSLSPRRPIPFCHACPLFNSSRAKKLFLLGFGYGTDGGGDGDQLRAGRDWLGSLGMWIYPSNNRMEGGWEQGMGFRECFIWKVHSRDKQRREGRNTKWGAEEGRVTFYLGDLC